VADLSFIENYKAVQKRLRGNFYKPIIIPKKEDVVQNKDNAFTEKPKLTAPPENITRLKILQDPSVRDYLRRASILEEGITYCQALLKGAEDIPKRIKLVVLPLLEESNFSWEELFGKDSSTQRNARTVDAVKVKWEIFKELHVRLNMNANQIASWCNMDRTSVAYGLGNLRKKKRK